jgi:hypothetical protein
LTHSSSAGGGASGLRSSRGRTSLILFFLLDLTGTSNPRSSNIICPDINGKILQSITINLALLRLLLGETQRISIVLSEVVDDALADEGDVKHAVEEIGGPIGVEGGVGDGVAQVADRGKGTADFKGAAADDGLGGGVFTTPVTSPGYQKLGESFPSV